MNENHAPLDPHDDSEASSLPDEELQAASGGKGGNGDGMILGNEGKAKGVIA